MSKWTAAEIISRYEAAQKRISLRLERKAIKNAASKVLHNPSLSKTAMVKDGCALTMRKPQKAHTQ